MMKKKLEYKNFLTFSLIFYLLLIFTNQFTSLEISTSMGFTDQLVYLDIINSAPHFLHGEIISPQVPRFFFPYVIGALCEYIQFKNHLYYVLIFINIFINLLTILLFLEITRHINIKTNINIILLSALIFNAYNFRANLYAPAMLNDALFTYGFLLITCFFINKKINYFYIGLVICCLTRQTSMILNIVFLILIFYEIIFKGNTTIGIFVNGILINIFLFFVLKYISSNFFGDTGSYGAYLFPSISALFLSKYTFLDLLIVILRMIVANFFLISLLSLFILKYNFHKKKINFDFIIILLLGLSVWVQPILGSPSFTGSNISRLTILSFPIFLILFSIIFKDFEINLLDSGIIIVLIFLSSMHHSYTYFFNLFFEFKNYHYAIISFLLHFIIVVLFLKAYDKHIQKVN